MAFLKPAEPTLLKNLRIYFPGSSFHQKKCDLLLVDGTIKTIEPVEKDSLKEGIDFEGSFLLPGLMDIRASFADPGYEEDEDLITGANAAALGGFTSVAINPNTAPVIDNKSMVEYIKNKSGNLPVNIFPLGAVTLKNEGKELAELYDMSLSGALAFTDHKNSIDDPHLLMRALLYTQGFNKKIIQLPDAKQLSAGGKMHEGKVSTINGLKGIPSLAEELMVSRDLDVAAFYGCSIHLGGISSAKSVDLIRSAKAQGMKVTCDVHAINLLFNEDALEGFDSNFKIKPPLRTEADRLALIEGLVDGTIDIICSDHAPKEHEKKVKEFDLASFGASQIETAFLQAYKALGKDSIPLLVEKMSVQPRKIFGIEQVALELGNPVEFVLFSPQKKWNYNKGNKQSKAANSPVLNQTFDGKIEGIFCKKQLILFPEK
jgi:dihydroorotase